MPTNVVARRPKFAMLRRANGSADESQEPLVDPVAATNVLRDEDATIVVEPDGPAVERFVVKRAESEAVVGGVGTSCGVPLDVRSFDAEVGSLELSVIATDGAPVFVDPEDRVAEGRVAFERATNRHPWHADRVEDVVVVGRFPMSVEELLGNRVDEVGLGAECVVEIRGQAAVGAGAADNGESRVVAVGCFVEVGLEGVALGDLPKAIRLQVPKRILGPGGPRWAEVLEECAEVALNFGEWDQSVFATLECGQGIEQEQWFVRGPFTATTPNVDLGETVEDGFGVGSVVYGSHTTIIAAAILKNDLVTQTNVFLGYQKRKPGKYAVLLISPVLVGDE